MSPIGILRRRTTFRSGIWPFVRAALHLLARCQESGPSCVPVRMSPSNGEERFTDDLQQVAEVLRDQRATLDPLAFDAVKLRAMSRARRSTSSGQKGFFMRSRLATVLTIAFLSLGTGGALALSGGHDFGL